MQYSKEIFLTDYFRVFKGRLKHTVSIYFKMYKCFVFGIFLPQLTLKLGVALLCRVSTVSSVQHNMEANRSATITL